MRVYLGQIILSDWPVFDDLSSSSPHDDTLGKETKDNTFNLKTLSSLWYLSSFITISRYRDRVAWCQYSTHSALCLTF